MRRRECIRSSGVVALCSIEFICCRANKLYQCFPLMRDIRIKWICEYVSQSVESPWKRKC